MEASKANKPPTMSKIEELVPEDTELAYVTSVDFPTITFFAQLCKFSYKELTNFEATIESFCKSVKEKRSSGEPDCCAPLKIRPGDIYCAKYPKNEKWYRGVVIDKDPSGEKKWSILFLDYGNITNTAEDDMIQVSLDQIPEIRRAPFGISCYLKDSDECDDETAQRLLNSLKNNYVMIKTLKQQSNLQYMVDIPMHAYNTPFWNSFDPGLTRAHNSRAGQRNLEDMSKEVELAAIEEEVVVNALGG